jgi:tol-pal system protein YbgF
LSAANNHGPLFTENMPGRSTAPRRFFWPMAGVQWTHVPAGAPQSPPEEAFSMCKRSIAVILLVGTAFLGWAARPAAAEDKGIIQLQQTVSLLLNQIADLQKSFNTQIGMIQGLVTENTDTVNKLATRIGAIQDSLNGAQVIASQRQSDISKQFQALSDTIATLQAHLQKMDTTLQQVHQMQQTIPPPTVAPAGNGMGGSDGATPATNLGTGASGGAASDGPVAAPTALQAYQSALSDFQNNSPRALGELAGFIRQYPNDPQIPDATYYLGTIFMARQQYSEAIDRFSNVIELYPDSSKAPMAELNKGISLAKLGQRTAAISELRALAKNYPRTEAARQADIELRSFTRGR